MADIHPEVAEAVELLRDYRVKQIELGKTAHRLMGNDAKPLIQDKWNPVDAEFNRIADNESLNKYWSGYNTKEDAIEDMCAYYHEAVTPEKFEVCREKLKQEAILENDRIKERNAKLEAYKKTHPDREIQLQELKSTDITDEQVKQYYDEAIPEAVNRLLKGDLDETTKSNINQLGHLNFLKRRVPIDTSYVRIMKNGKEFSFDNNLRSYDLDSIITKNMQRFAGEEAVNSVFGSQKALSDFLQRSKDELQLASRRGLINGSVVDSKYKKLENSILELRGMKPNEDLMNKTGAFFKILRNLAYAKRGALMGMSQATEASSTIAYGGIAQLAHIFKPLGEFVDNCRWNKHSAEVIREVVDTDFGLNIEKEIWSMNHGDRAVRDALTANNDIRNKTLKLFADGTAELGKITSTLNMMPRMTDSMTRGMRAQTIMDTIKWSQGNNVGMLRNPFSKAKLKASHISSKDAEVIKSDIRKYVSFDKDDNIQSFNTTAWKAENPIAFAKWYDMITTQTERALVDGSKQGNKSFLKNANKYTQLMFQFKDFNMRALNGQTLRTMTAGDLDDSMAAAGSVVSNLAVYAARAALVAGTYEAMGDHEKAEKYRQTMFDDGAILRATLCRSTIVGSPLSFLNDGYEAVMGAPTIRTTVDRPIASQQKDRSVDDVFGDFVSQFPAVQEANSIIKFGYAMKQGAGGGMSKKDYKAILNFLPMPNIIGYPAYINHLVETSDYPNKRLTNKE